MENNIHPTAIIYDGVTIGTGNTIGAYCIIGAPPEWKGKHSIGNVIIGNNNTLTGLVTIDSGAEITTTIGDNCYLMKHSYVAHDCTLKDNVTLSAGVKIGGYATIGENTNIGMNATIHQKVSIPEGCMIGASSFVGKTSKLKPKHKYAGVPVRELGENIKK